MAVSAEEKNPDNISNRSKMISCMTPEVSKVVVPSFFWVIIYWKNFDNFTEKPMNCQVQGLTSI